MADSDETWHPGSFTKNFSWGQKGLSELHSVIRLGFEGEATDVPRSEFRRRVAQAGRPDFIPINFFLFNQTIDGIDYVICDELVFQAVTYEHSERFDLLAMFAFNFSFAGTWAGAKSYQRRPALWANAYFRRLLGQNGPPQQRISANDIQNFILSSGKYKAKTSRKLSTNLNYIYKLVDISTFDSEKVARWWVDCVFLALDRIIHDRQIDGKATFESQYLQLLGRNGFDEISGRGSIEKRIALKHLVRLYATCGGVDRFSDEYVCALTKTHLADLDYALANDRRPVGAVYPTNPRILKTIPRVCAMLAKYVAGFEILLPDDIETFNIDDFVRTRTVEALSQLKEAGIKPTMTAEELMRITRQK